MSSDAPVPADGMFEQLTAIKRTIRGEDDSDSDDEKDSGGAHRVLTISPVVSSYQDHTPFPTARVSL